ncbi:Nn.00g053340.m01.CDS01 [Neocucurbitaria sp. VM-36]
MVSKSMLNTLLKKQLAYEPELQPYFTFSNGSWTSVSPDASLLRSTAPQRASLNSFRVITWNIDFMASYPRARMDSALSHLEQLVSTIPDSCATVIHLQEMMETEGAGEQVPDDLKQLVNAHWIQKGFNLTDINSLSWDAPYGQVTVVDRRLAISGVSRLRFVSEYQRDALFVDIRLDTPEMKYLRLCNVHLDSSYGSMRPVQWSALAKHLQNGDEGISASILAGDCNANQARDRTVPQEHGFKDAYLGLGGVEGDDLGATWGFQSADAKRWGPQRLDKVVYWGDVRADGLERIGVGIQVEDERIRSKLEDEGEVTFVTDHYGLIGHFTLGDALCTATTGDS